MEKEKKNTPTNGELEILEILWGNKSATVREVYDIISIKKKCAYTSTLKIMQKMTAKGLIKRTVKEQIHTYEAAIEESKVRNSSVTELINKFFQGSYSKLALHALGQSSGDLDIDKLVQLLNQLKQKKH